MCSPKAHWLFHQDTHLDGLRKYERCEKNVTSFGPLIYLLPFLESQILVSDRVFVLESKKVSFNGFFYPMSHILSQTGIYPQTQNKKMPHDAILHNIIHNVSIHLVTVIDLLRSTYVMFLMHRSGVVLIMLCYTLAQTILDLTRLGLEKFWNHGAPSIKFALLYTHRYLHTMQCCRIVLARVSYPSQSTQTPFLLHHAKLKWEPMLR